MLFYNTGLLTESHESNISTYLYSASLFVETLIIRQNVLDAISQAKSDEKFNISKEKNIFNLLFKGKKDPVLLVVLYENAITFFSTCIPLIS